MATCRGDATYWNGVYAFGTTSKGAQATWRCTGTSKSPYGYHDPIARPLDHPRNTSSGTGLLLPAHGAQGRTWQPDLPIDRETRMPVLAKSKSFDGLQYSAAPADPKPFASFMQKWTQNDHQGHGTFLWTRRMVADGRAMERAHERTLEGRGWPGPGTCSAETLLGGADERQVSRTQSLPPGALGVLQERPMTYPPTTGWHYQTSDKKVHPLGHAGGQPLGHVRAPGGAPLPTRTPGWNRARV